MKESAGGEEPNKIEIGISTIKQVEKEANSIFDDVIEEKNLSEYYLKETMFKTLYLKEQLTSGLETIQNGLIEETKRKKKGGLFIPIFAILNLFITSISPIIGLINSIIIVINVINNFKENRQEAIRILSLQQKLYDIVEKANQTQITLSNNETFTLKRLKELGYKKEKEATTSPKNISLIDVANRTIQLYIDSDILPTNMPPEIEGTVRKLLQNDLNTKETNIKVLLDSAKEKASLDALVHRME